MYKIKLIIVTVLNCFVFVHFGVLFLLLFKKMNVLRDAAICFLTVTLIELLQLLTIIQKNITKGTEAPLADLCPFFVRNAIVNYS